VIEVLPVLTAVATGAVGFIAGRWRRRSRIPVSANPQPICKCEHPLSSHDPATGACNDWIHMGGARQYSSNWRECSCLQYVGPRPAEVFFTTEVAWDDAVMRQPPKE
jgi:hypothetical protein